MSVGQNIFEKNKIYLSSCLDKMKLLDDNSVDLIVADPPYIGTNDTFEYSFTEQDTSELFEILIGIGIRFMISEFDTPFILGLAEKHKLNVITLGERKNLMNKRTEILITNYEKPMSLFD